VVLTDVLDDLGTQVAAEIGDSARYVHLEVTSESGWAEAVQTAISTFGPVRVLVNNAGVLIRGSTTAAPSRPKCGPPLVTGFPNGC